MLSAKPFTHFDTETNHHCPAAGNSLRGSSAQEKEEKRPTAAAQQLPTVSRRQFPSEVQPLTISPQQASTKTDLVGC